MKTKTKNTKNKNKNKNKIYNIIDYIDDIKYKISNLFYCLNNFIHRRDLIRTKIGAFSNPDLTSLILYGLMNSLVDFVENGEYFKHINTTYNKHVRKEADEIMEIYKWWKNYNNRCDIINQTLSEWSNEVKIYEDGNSWCNIFNKNYKTPKTKALDKKHSILENQLEKETQEMLHKIIDLRPILWR